MQTAVIVFPASNCDRDAAVALEKVTGRAPKMIWHRETEIPSDVKFVVMPGGFSYGDYLRSGAIAARSPIVADLKVKAEKGLAVAGFCNGFQVLTEAGMLPGVLMRNAGLTFVCRDQKLEVVARDCAFTGGYSPGQVIEVPIAHHDGNFSADAELVRKLEAEDRVAFRYVDNPNGSAGDIAGVLSENRRVLGMMPHPERAAEAIHGSTDGAAMFTGLQSILAPA